MNLYIKDAYTLNMDDLINIKSKEFFNIDYVFPYQRLVIANTLRASGYFGDEEKKETLKKQIVILPTGAGKSLCFMLPGILLDGITLIIFPLLSLMTDQERRITESGSTVVTLKGGLKRDERNRAYAKIKKGEIKFILTNPETLQNKEVLKVLAGSNISHTVIDETHTVSQWGESFRPTYLEVGKYIKIIGVEQITAYTATASDYIINSVKKHIFLNEELNIVKGNPDRTNIHYSVIPCINKMETLIDIIKRIEKPAIIFHNSRVSAELTSINLSLRLNRDDIVYYHAGLTSNEKKSIEEWFFDNDSGILNATCAYGMGVDKQNIRTVIHLEAPTTIEAYLQESGRAGRDRNPARAILLTSKRDRDSPILDSLRNNSSCRREVLLSLLGSETEYCSGCDICDGSLQKEELGLKQLVLFFKKNNGVYNITESANILKGYYTFHAVDNQYHNTHGFGIMDKWDLDSIKDSIKYLIEIKVLTVSKNPLFRGIIKLKTNSLIYTY